MEITKVITQSIQATTAKKAEKPGEKKQKFSLDEASEQIQAKSSPGIMLTPIDALFLNLDQRRKERKQALNKSEEILKQLEYLRVGIISGKISKNILENIANLLEGYSKTITEEPLQSLLLEVETRAKVELAKLEKAV